MVAHDLHTMKPAQFVQCLKMYLTRFKRGLEILNKNRSRLNDDQRANGVYISDLGASFESIFLMEAECPVQSQTFSASIQRQHIDLQKLTQWNLEVFFFFFFFLFLFSALTG